jgi:hypothetical protein
MRGIDRVNVFSQTVCNTPSEPDDADVVDDDEADDDVEDDGHDDDEDKYEVKRVS